MLGSLSVVYCLVCSPMVQAELPGQGDERIFGSLGKEKRGQIPSIISGVVEGETMCFKEAKIEGYVVTYYGMVFYEVFQALTYGGKMGGAADLVGSDACKSLDEFRDGPSWIDKSFEPFQHLVTLEFDRPHLNNFFPVGVQPSRFQVEGHKGSFQRG